MRLWRRLLNSLPQIFPFHLWLAPPPRAYRHTHTRRHTYIFGCHATSIVLLLCETAPGLLRGGVCEVGATGALAGKGVGRRVLPEGRTRCC